jgi:hypothetical protein
VRDQLRKPWLSLPLGIVAVLFALWLVNMAHRKLQPEADWQRRVDHLRHEVELCEAKQLAAQKALGEKQGSRNRDVLDAYYAFREVEMQDQEAWNLAAKQVDGNLTALSNKAAAATSRLNDLRMELTAAQRQSNGIQPTSK